MATRTKCMIVAVAPSFKARLADRGVARTSQARENSRQSRSTLNSISNSRKTQNSRVFRACSKKSILKVRNSKTPAPKLNSPAYSLVIFGFSIVCSTSAIIKRHGQILIATVRVISMFFNQAAIMHLSSTVWLRYYHPSALSANSGTPNGRMGLLQLWSP